MLNVKKISLLALCLVISLTACDKKPQQQPEQPINVIEATLAEISKHYADDKKCYLKLPKELLSNEGAKYQFQDIPTIHFVLTMNETFSNQPNQEETLFREIKSAVDRGCDINEVFEGLRPLEISFIFQKDKKMFAFLMENGADPLAKNQSDSKNLSGLNIFEMAEILKKKSKHKQVQDMAEFILTYQDKQSSPKQ